MELNDYLNYYNIELTANSGIEIARHKGPVYTHPGIIMGRDKHTGRERVFHNHRDHGGTAIVDMAVYENGYRSYPTGRPSDGEYAVLMRCFQQLENKRSYGLVTYNCQDATKYAREGKLGSHAVANTLGTIAVVGILAALFGGNKD